MALMNALEWWEGAILFFLFVLMLPVIGIALLFLYVIVEEKIKSAWKNFYMRHILCNKLRLNIRKARKQGRHEAAEVLEKSLSLIKKLLNESK